MNTETAVRLNALFQEARHNDPHRSELSVFMSLLEPAIDQMLLDMKMLVVLKNVQETCNKPNPYI